MNKKFNEKIKTSYDAISDAWNEKREGRLALACNLGHVLLYEVIL